MNELLLLPPVNVWGKVIFLHLSVILFTGGSTSLHAGIHPLGADTPQDLRQAPPTAVHAGRYGQQAGGTHPNGMQSCSKGFCTKVERDTD